MPSFSAELPADLWRRWIAHSAALLDSYRARTGGDLVSRGGGAEAEAERLLTAPFVVVSHGAEADPMLNYGNRVALALWEMNVERLLATPSRLTAEPMLREARERLLTQTAREGFISGYEGVRISATGRRFHISNVTIWNVADAAGAPAGQAATFARWTYL
ncbi:MEKHLA domain-containing protein [Methylocystis parvus]|uniref:MEKHLA domain-containing protein n=1 Tax=Methylocystis parvus TaxID=134 RepID=A0A6B8M6T0_9HYPH|nr:MEKHLA domain-containing protein [Methylocystis parvus]QGM97722.1 MEKHLA domain-containing protein [Methylocystis parvus]WBK01975.1 MEKHLA domain-containing protein [Methylocystis parvus OBBP]